MSGDTVSAEEQFKKYGDYLQSEQMLYECQYVRALRKMDSENFDGAAADLQTLFRKVPNYKDTDAKLTEAVKLHTEALLEQNGYEKAADFLNDYRHETKEVGEYAEKVTSVIYKEAEKMYRAGDYIRARDCFEKLLGYKDSDKYKVLSFYSSDDVYSQLMIKASPEKCCRELIEIIDFKNAKEVLVSETVMAVEFLRGTWKTSDEKYYFTMKDNGKAIYNLPSAVPKSASEEYLESLGITPYTTTQEFEISDGVYSISSGNELVPPSGATKVSVYPVASGNETKKVFRFTVIDADTIEIYCYKDGSTETAENSV